MAIGRRRTRRHMDVWPGYVDVLSSLLILVIFVLMLFTFSQFLLSYLLSNQESELGVLRQRTDELTELLGLERKKTAGLGKDLSRLSSLITSLTEDKFELTGKVEDLTHQTQASEEALRQKTLLLASLQQGIDALRQERQTLEARLTSESKRTAQAQQDLVQREVRIQALTALVGERDRALGDQRLLSAEAQAQVVLLNHQIEGLRDQLQEIGRALQAAEKDKADQQVKLDDLGRRLNLVLARQVNRLEKYRSEFFGRLRQVLGNNPAVRVVGDRFLFQSELLFDSGSTTLGPAGIRELTKLAGTLKELAAQIPKDIDWVLQVEGHTDRVPIHTKEIPSNWELSTARAISVVRFLIAQGIPARRLSAAGFADLHPLDPADTPEAYRKNRRIEIRLTSG